MVVEISRPETRVNIPLSAIIALIEQLEPAEMYAIYEWLDARLSDLEDELLATNPRFQAELQEARREYQAGNYITLDELWAIPLQRFFQAGRNVP